MNKEKDNIHLFFNRLNPREVFGIILEQNYKEKQAKANQTP